MVDTFGPLTWGEIQRVLQVPVLSLAETVENPEAQLSMAARKTGSQVELHKHTVVVCLVEEAELKVMVVMQVLNFAGCLDLRRRT